MQHIFGTAIGKALGRASRLRGGGGQALPGLVVERLFPNYLAHMLAKLPDGVVVVTGTNGKTTTTKMIVELLQTNGKRVLTNPTGSNFTRGVVSSLVQQAKISGHLPFDIGVFELDEAYALQFVRQVKPHWVLALNVMRDQLDRFGELDTAAKMVADVLRQATDGVVINDDDARLVAAAASIPHRHYFGVAPGVRRLFPTDDEIVAVDKKAHSAKPHPRVTELSAFKNQQVTFTFGKSSHDTTLQLSGNHNFQNAAAALALVTLVVPDVSPQTLVAQLASVKPAFGRGQRFVLKDGSSLQLILVKNPAGFRQALASYPVGSHKVMLAINDDYADGRDVSWLWDVDFTSLKTVALTSGTRAADMALRLQYDDVPVAKINEDIEAALREFCHTKGDKLLITTYTAMLRFYKLLKKEAGTTL